MRYIFCAVYILLASVYAHGNGSVASTADKKDPAIAQQSAFTLGDQILKAIVEDQETLFQKLQKNPKTTPAEQELLLSNIEKRYAVFCSQNPKNIYGFIFYGKFLRTIGAYSKAKMIFMRANEINPSIAVIKQQLGNCFAEEGSYAMALHCFLEAVALEPKVAQYHYQIGELLIVYRKEFLAEKIFNNATLEKKIQDSLLEASRLDPQERSFTLRYAESFYELEKPDWQAALKVWESIEKSSQNTEEKDVIALNRARIYLQLKQFKTARSELDKIFNPKWETARQELLTQLPK